MARLAQSHPSPIAPNVCVAHGTAHLFWLYRIERKQWNRTNCVWVPQSKMGALFEPAPAVRCDAIGAPCFLSSWSIRIDCRWCWNKNVKRRIITMCQQTCVSPPRPTNIQVSIVCVAINQFSRMTTIEALEDWLTTTMVVSKYWQYFTWLIDFRSIIMLCCMLYAMLWLSVSMEFRSFLAVIKLEFTVQEHQYAALDFCGMKYSRSKSGEMSIWWSFFDATTTVKTNFCNTAHNLRWMMTTNEQSVEHRNRRWWKGKHRNIVYYMGYRRNDSAW